MFHIHQLRSRLLLPLLLALTACGELVTEEPSLATTQLELDDMGTAPEGAQLILLSSGAEQGEVTRALDAMGVRVVHRSYPRLMVVENLPEGADRLLRNVGVRQRFARAVSPTELRDLSVAESRFVRVFSNRYYPEATPRSEQIVPTRFVRRADEPFEQAAPEQPSLSRAAAAALDVPEQERNVWVPYASGRVVVSVILPESNGRGEPSTEDWNEATILETYAKVHAGLEGISRHEPNAKLDFVLHYESAPASRGLAGTVDVDFEFGKRVAEGANLGQTYAQIFSRVLGREISESEQYEAQREYLNGLRDRYSADGAFIIYVAANQNYTAGFRAYAYINGPQTNLHTGYGYEVFAHEFGHIFGALDEYCPDQCIYPASTAGYLGMVNANAQFRPGNQGGIQGGRGESQPSLMMGNITNGVNGYTRGAWGWLDTDGDGIVEVRDTTPLSELSAAIVNGQVHLTGRVVDQPATTLYATPYSVNRIAAVHVRARGQGDSAWLRFSLPAVQRGRQLVDLNLGALPRGHHEFEVRAENSVGNLEQVAQIVAVDVVSGPRNGAPLASLKAEARVTSPGASVTLRADAYDPEGRPLRARFDVDGDGRYDTPFQRELVLSFRAPRAGVIQVGVEVIDEAGQRARARTELYVLERDAPAHAELSPLPSPVVSVLDLPIRAEATSVRDPEGQPVSLNFRVERDDAERSYTVESGFGSATAYDSLLTTEPALSTRAVDVSNLDRLDPYTSVYDVERLSPNVLALALGNFGVMFVDTTSPTAPRLITRLSLEVDAFDLLRDGSSLFVLGDKLSVIDIQNLEAPVERPQLRITRNQRRVVSDGEWPLSEEPTKGVPLFASFQEKIEAVRVEATVTHPNFSELTLALETPAGQRIVLWNRQAAPSGTRTLRFDERTHPELSSLRGTLARGDFRLTAIDEVADGDKGGVSVSLIFDTSHRAFAGVSGASQLIGIPNARQILVGGEGLTLIDTSRKDALRTLSSLPGAPVANAVLKGTRAFVLAYPVEEEQKAKGEDWSDDNRGLYVVDVVRSRLLRGRMDVDVRGSSLTLAGSRLYVSDESGEIPSTLIGDQARFARGQAYVLGQSSLTVGRDARGDDLTLWNVRGAFERLDVSNPNKLTVIERFEYPRAGSVRFFDARTAFVLGAINELVLTDLSARTGVVSEVYRVTLEARDAQGNTTETSRSVHIIPYDHAPTITSARVTRNVTSRDPVEIEVGASDPDGRPTWDNLVAVRVDWEGDGLWDGYFQGIYELGVFTHLYARGGDYTVRLQARDGFYGLSEVYELPIHVEQYVPIPCSNSDACPDGEYCELSSAQACAGQGLCERPRQDCWGGEVVCGCDGVTYRSPCEAQAAGASVAQAGICPGEVSVCGGANGQACSVPGMFCRYPVGETPELSCGAGGVAGECVFGADGCFVTAEPGIRPIGRQVCGCDGVTYFSSCDADRAGVSIKKYGSCEPDCLETGCAAGEVCQSCWVNHSCVPEGTVCLRSALD